MGKGKIMIPKEVYDGLEAVRLSSKTNMLDVPRVIEIAMEMGYVDTAFWVYENRKAYASGVFSGYEQQEGDMNKCGFALLALYVIYVL
ncbi:MAG: DUF5049 domain-containing protein [Armatimonadota bacterium]